MTGSVCSIQRDVLAFWRLDAMAIVLAYAARVWFKFHRRSLVDLARSEPPADRSVRVTECDVAEAVPFAIWVWVTHLLYNLFEVVDRYMVSHGAVGKTPGVYCQVHSAQVIPVFIVSVAGLLAGMIFRISVATGVGRTSQGSRYAEPDA